ncbi:tRNA lysidine(34) synthetase TilS [Geomicrobium sp. JCM 19055]|uniref:tRNA lysidine(34) synthetase TilS n=1 Tax=Geomicrobium sp. JCM 19055 TaxID=1460649 RepID=UPI00045ED047|nr:tRNA lysidine(34) synthetase TilS [Geomicrobium sp. JCM 19055]GAK01418.1 tRNA(Ile)-lysidine synthetase [Geomicrobium sp. JCM 19055]
MKQIDNFVKRHHLLQHDEVVVAAVSGGVDSMLMLHWLIHHTSHRVIVAHVHHGLRQQSDDERLMIEQYCEAYNIKFYFKRIDLKGNRVSSKSIQNDARAIRYAFFSEVMQKENAATLVTGHHGDDQVETVLMKITRGHVGGSIGIKAKRKLAEGVVVRPLLGLTKAEIVAVASEESVPWFEDASNADQSYTRNRYRSRILPEIQKENERYVQSYQQFVEEYDELRAYVTQEAENLLRDCVVYEQGQAIVALTRFRKHAIPLQRQAIHLLLNYLYQSQAVYVSRVHIEDCLRLVFSSNPSAEIALSNGYICKRDYESLCFLLEDEPTDLLELNQRVEEVPSAITTSYGILTFEKSLEQRQASEHECFIPMKDASFPLIVRTRNRGDVIEPKGLDGRQKLNRIFIDQKVTRRARDQWPVVTDSKGNILWLPLLKKSRFTTERADSYVLITLQRSLKDAGLF